MKKKDTGPVEGAARQSTTPGNEPARALRTAPPDKELMLRAKGDDEPLLQDVVVRTGQQRALRRLLLDDGKYTTEAVALMTYVEICTCVQLDYAVVGVTDDGDDILIVRRDRLAEYNGLVTHIRR